jgi:hypothetical protein
MSAGANDELIACVIDVVHGLVDNQPGTLDV